MAGDRRLEAVALECEKQGGERGERRVGADECNEAAIF